VRKKRFWPRLAGAALLLAVMAAAVAVRFAIALDAGRVKRTAGDLRTVATAVESYSIDNCQYLAVGDVPVSHLAQALEPTYVRKLPTRDGWSSPLLFRGGTNEYTVTSWGSDRRRGGGGTVAPDGRTTSFRNDIVFSTGSFLQYPGEMGR
jgi:hypothetical protein